MGAIQWTSGVPVAPSNQLQSPRRKRKRSLTRPGKYHFTHETQHCGDADDADHSPGLHLACFGIDGLRVHEATEERLRAYGNHSADANANANLA